MARAISFILGVPWSAASTPFIRKKPTPMASRAVSGREDEPEPLAAVEVEGLVPPFGGEDVGHSACSLLCWSSRSGSRRPARRRGSPDEDLPGHSFAERAVLAVRPAARGARRRGASPGPRPPRRAAAPRVSRKATIVRVGRAGQGDHGHVAGLEVVQRRHRGDVGHLGLGDREAVRAGRRAVEGDEQPVLDLLGQLVLEARGQPVGLVPGVAEHVGEEPLDDAVAADDGHRRLAADRGQLHAPVGGVVDQAPVGQPLDRRGHGARGDAEGVGQVAGVGRATRHVDPGRRSGGRSPSASRARIS